MNRELLKNNAIEGLEQTLLNAFINGCVLKNGKNKKKVDDSDFCVIIEIMSGTWERNIL